MSRPIFRCETCDLIVAHSAEATHLKGKKCAAVAAWRAAHRNRSLAHDGLTPIGRPSGALAELALVEKLPTAYLWSNYRLLGASEILPVGAVHITHRRPHAPRWAVAIYLSRTPMRLRRKALRAALHDADLRLALYAAFESENDTLLAALVREAVNPATSEDAGSP